MRSRFFRRLTTVTFSTVAMLAAPPANAADDKGYTGLSESQQAKRIAQFADLTPEHFAKTATISGDELDVAVTIDTAAGYKFKHRFTDPVRSEVLLRAMISRQTGATTYQVYARIAYSLEQRFFQNATYVTAEGPVSARLTIIDHDIICQYGTCVFTDIMVFDIPERTLRNIAARADERPVKPWRFRYQSGVGLDWTDDIAPAEAAGLLMAVDRYQNGR